MQNNVQTDSIIIIKICQITFKIYFIDKIQNTGLELNMNIKLQQNKP
jgi:hypothetical protein